MSETDEKNLWDRLVALESRATNIEAEHNRMWAAMQPPAQSTSESGQTVAAAPDKPKRGRLFGRRTK